MKARERKRQKQTARMYLRGKDHRDCIMNDTYHNAIWMKKEQDGQQKDELVWLKYPQKCIYLQTKYNTSGSASTYSKGWLDLDRLWINAKNDQGSTGNAIAKLDSFVVSSRIAYSDSWTLDVTKDGCIHKSVRFSDGRYKIRRFEGDKFIVFWNGSSYPWSTLYMNIYTIEDFETDDFTITTLNSALPLSNSYFSWYFLTGSSDGCWIYLKNGNNNDVYELSMDVATEDITVTHLYSDNPTETEQPNLIGSGSTRATEHNGCYFCVNAYSEKVGSSSVYVQDIALQYSYSGTFWSIERIRILNNGTTSTAPKPYLCVRNNKVYLYCTYTPTGTAYLTKAYNVDSRTQTVTEIELLNQVITIPVYGQMGKGTMETAPIEYVQIQLDSTAETTELSYHIKDLLSDDIIDGWGSIEFKDGELQQYVEDDFLILSTTYGGGRNIYFHISADLKPNIDNYAWISDSFSNSNGAETLYDGDYCYQGGTLESEVI